MHTYCTQWVEYQETILHWVDKKKKHQSLLLLVLYMLFSMQWSILDNIYTFHFLERHCNLFGRLWVEWKHFIFFNITIFVFLYQLSVQPFSTRTSLQPIWSTMLEFLLPISITIFVYFHQPSVQPFSTIYLCLISFCVYFCSIS